VLLEFKWIKSIHGIQCQHLVKFYRSYLFSIDESGPSAAVGEAQLSRFIKGFTASLQSNNGFILVSSENEQIS